MTHSALLIGRARIALPRVAAVGVRPLVSALTIVVAAIPLMRFLSVALSRIDYPFDLEWCEGGVLAHIRVILSGHQPYGPPSLDFTAYGYTPLYYYVSALFSLVLGYGHLAPRLVSLLSILGCFILVGRWVRNETGDRVAGIAAIGLFSGVYAVTGYWFDLARIDSLFLLLVLGSLTAARAATGPGRAALAGVLLAAACFTKQVGFPIGVAVLLVVALRSLRLAVITAVVAGGLVVLGAIVLDVVSRGWFLYYTITMLGHHDVDWPRLWPSVQTFFLTSTFPMTLAAAAVACGLGFRARSGRRRWLGHAALIAVVCAASFMPFLKTGGYPNGLIPAYAALALASGIAVAAVRRTRLASALGRVGPAAAACALLAMQIVALDYERTAALPSAADLAANREVMSRLRHLEKPIFITGSSFYGMTVDGHVVTDTMGLVDVFKAGGPEAVALDRVLAEAIRTHHFKTIVIDRAAGFLPGNYVDLIRQEYVQSGSVLDGLPADVIWPKSGAEVRPDTVWVPK